MDPATGQERGRLQPAWFRMIRSYTSQHSLAPTSPAVLDQVYEPQLVLGELLAA